MRTFALATVWGFAMFVVSCSTSTKHPPPVSDCSGDLCNAVPSQGTQPAPPDGGFDAQDGDVFAPPFDASLDTTFGGPVDAPFGD